MTGGEKDLALGKDAAAPVHRQAPPQGIVREQPAEGLAVDEEHTPAHADFVAGHGGDGLEEEPRVGQVAPLTHEQPHREGHAKSDEIPFANARAALSIEVAPRTPSARS